MHQYDYGYGYVPIGAWGTYTVGESLKPTLTREGFALYMALRDQITQSEPGNRLVIRPMMSPAVQSWWQTIVNPLFGYFGEWVRSADLQNLGAWMTRLAQLRKEAAQLGLLVIPSGLFDAVDAELAEHPR